MTRIAPPSASSSRMRWEAAEALSLGIMPSVGRQDSGSNARRCLGSGQCYRYIWQRELPIVREILGGLARHLK